MRRQRMLCGCGCGERLSVVEGVEFDHDISLWTGGADEPGNLRAWRAPCHKRKTKREAKHRAKLTRIESTNGMRQRRPNKRERRLAAIKAYERMP